MDWASLGEVHLEPFNPLFKSFPKACLAVTMRTCVYFAVPQAWSSGPEAYVDCGEGAHFLNLVLPASEAKARKGAAAGPSICLELQASFGIGVHHQIPQVLNTLHTSLAVPSSVCIPVLWYQHPHKARQQRVCTFSLSSTKVLWYTECLVYVY